MKSQASNLDWSKATVVSEEKSDSTGNEQLSWDDAVVVSEGGFDASSDTSAQDDNALTFFENLKIANNRALLDVPVLGGILEAGANIAEGRRLKDVMAEQLKMSQELAYEDYYKYTQGEKERTVRTISGVSKDKPQTPMDSFLQSAFDFTGLIGAKKVTSVPSLLTNLSVIGANTAASGAGVATNELLQEFEGFKELPIAVQEVTSALLSGVTGAATAAGIGTVGKSFVDTAAVGYEKLKKAPDILGDWKVEHKLRTLRQNLTDEDIEGAVATFNEFKESFGVELPTSALLSDNPLMIQWLRQTAQAGEEGAKFKKQFMDKFNDDYETLLKGVEVITGDLGFMDEAEVRPIIAQREKKRQESIDRRMGTRLERLSEQEENLWHNLRFTMDDIDVGERANAIIQAKDKEIQEAAKVKYGYAAEIGTAAGLVIEPSETKAIYDMAKNLQLTDIFFTKPDPTQQVLKVFEPTVKEVETPVDAKGKPLLDKTNREPELEFSQVSLEDFDSLKRRVNFEIRRTKDENRLRSLYALKNVIQETVSSLGERSPEFAQAYRDADAFVWKEKGVPKDKEGLKAVSAAKFDITTGKQLEKFEQARDFLSYAGEEGLPVVQQAMRFKAFRNKSVFRPDGTINPNGLKAFVRANQKELELAGLMEEFSDATVAAKSITEARIKQQEDYEYLSEKYTGGFFKAVFNKDISGAVADMLKSPASLEKYMGQIDTLRGQEKGMALTAIRKSFVEKAMQDNTSFVKFLENNKQAAREIFGNNYISNLYKLGRLLDTLIKTNVNVNMALHEPVNIDMLTSVLGFSGVELIGTIRNQIMSQERKFITLLGKAATTKGSVSFEETSAKLLMDPNLVELLANPPKSEFSWQNAMSKGKAGVATLLSFLKKNAIENGMRGALLATLAETEQREGRTPDKPLAMPMGMLTGYSGIPQ